MEGVITGKLAKTLADHMVQEPKKSPRKIVDQHPEIFKVVEDLGSVEKAIDQVLSEQPQSVADYLAGKVKAFSFLIGQVMKATQGKAPPQAVNQLLKEKLEKRR
jgi:aspartyl-tRNA(Asn)/glutamyl-tRNA(Gln) amidotransferase subunit B